MYTQAAPDSKAVSQNLERNFSILKAHIAKNAFTGHAHSEVQKSHRNYFKKS